jgi:hypothetical protein
VIVIVRSVSIIIVIPSLGELPARAGSFGRVGRADADAAGGSRR